MLERCAQACIHELFEERVLKMPTACAVQFKGQRLDYESLNVRSNAVAWQLRERGIGPETFVGLSIERSIDAVVAVLGILKSGGAYVYLDPLYPAARLNAMMGDCRPTLVLDRISSEGSRENITSGVNPDNAAYLIYTSGSTGPPKGIIEIHRSLTARLSTWPLPDIQEQDVCALNSSLAFGISTSRLFLPLVCGIPVVIFPEEEVKDVGLFARGLEEHAVTSVFMVPALLRQVLALGTTVTDRLQRIRAVTVSGGILAPDLVKNYFLAFPNALLVNNYGSTEIGTSAATKVYTKQTDARTITIGRAATNSRIAILDDGMRPVPDGEIGEICVAARHLARGYLNLPGLTAERFLCDLNGERIYRSGDLGRRRLDGEIEFLGRSDQQVKIRGFRVELGEIETAFKSHQSVREAAVIAVDTGGDKQLWAYLSLRPGCVANPAQFREFLGLRLLDHMIPTRYWFPKDLPYTDAGKVDRAALASLEASTSVYTWTEGPADSIEQALTEIWREVLDLQRVCRTDNFVALGGDSLQASQVIGRIETLCGFRMTLQSLFDQTLAEVAREIAAARSAGG